MNLSVTCLFARVMCETLLCLQKQKPYPRKQPHFPLPPEIYLELMWKCFSFPLWETRLGEGQQSVCLGGEGGEILGEDRQTPVRLGGGGGGGQQITEKTKHSFLIRWVETVRWRKLENWPNHWRSPKWKVRRPHKWESDAKKTRIWKSPTIASKTSMGSCFSFLHKPDLQTSTFSHYRSA